MLSGCARTYQETGFTGGYRDFQIEDRVYTVSFSGNGYSNEQDVYLLFLTRCAELAIDNGYPFFYLIESSDDTTTEEFTQPGESTTSSSGAFTGSYSWHGNSGQLYGQGTVTSRTQYRPPRTYTVTKPAFSGRILLVRERLHDAPSPYNARLVYRQGTDLSEDIKQRNRRAGLVYGGILGVGLAPTLLMLVLALFVGL